MPRRHIETRNIVFHKVDIPNGSLCMMKTEISTNGEAPIEAREHRRATITQDHKRTGSARFDQASDRSVKEKKQSLFRRPSVIVVAAALAVVGIGYGGFSVFYSVTQQNTHEAVFELDFVCRAPKSARLGTEVPVGGHQAAQQ